MSVAVTYRSDLTVIETLTGPRPFATDAKAKVTHDVLNKTDSLGAATTPPATKVAAFQKALAAGVGTIDLTALVGTNGVAVDGSGLKVQAIKLSNPATNGNPISITEGAANGYAAFGAGWKLTLAPGQEALLYGADATPDVAAGDKNIDLAGTGSQALDMVIVLG